MDPRSLRDGIALLRDGPHRRLNPLTGRWVLVSAGRTARPWRGREDAPAATLRPSHDPRCPLCPGNERSGGLRNPAYEGTFAFPNDFPGLVPDTPEATIELDPLFRAATAPGTCRVLCFSHRHDLDLALMTAADIRRVVDLWVDQIAELGPRYRSVVVFENRGAEMGASSPHPHGQLWASGSLPDEVGVEDERQRAWSGSSSEPMLVRYAELEAGQAERVVVEGADWLVVVPFWAVWPFETLIVPRRRVARFTDLDDAERASLSEVLRRLLARYDNLFRCLFPYSMGWHGAPGAQGDSDHWQLHAHVLPPLLRSATTRKFMAGYELFAEAARDLTAEEAADRLRHQSEVHFLAGTGGE